MHSRYGFQHLVQVGCSHRRNVFGGNDRSYRRCPAQLLLATGRLDEARRLLERLAATLSEGMLANTADVGQTEYNTADATLWFLHAVGRYVDVTGDDDLAAALLPALEGVVNHHLEGTRYGIHVDATSDDNRIIRNEVSGSPADVRDDGTGNCWKANTYATGSVPSTGCP